MVKGVNIKVDTNTFIIGATLAIGIFAVYRFRKEIASLGNVASGIVSVPARITKPITDGIINLLTNDYLEAYKTLQGILRRHPNPMDPNERAFVEKYLAFYESGGTDDEFIYKEWGIKRPSILN